MNLFWAYYFAFLKNDFKLKVISSLGKTIILSDDVDDVSHYTFLFDVIRSKT